MSRSRLAAFAPLLAATLWSAPLARAGSTGACTIATRGDSPTAFACAQGGRVAAVKVMKQMLKAARRSRLEFACDDCHRDQLDYQLTSNARKDYSRLVAAQPPR